jgi:hypothetical protein
MGSETTVTDPYATDPTALFIDRAARVAPAYVLTDVNGRMLSDICQLLEGSPLAIELAASWIRVLSPHDLLTHLTTAQSMPASDVATVEDRHRSMHAVLDSSWQWLSSEERSVLSALAVFVGGCTLEATQSVAGAVSARSPGSPNSHCSSGCRIPPAVLAIRCTSYALDRLGRPQWCARGTFGSSSISPRARTVPGIRRPRCCRPTP